MPYFCRSGHPVVTVDQFLDFVDLFLPQEPVLALPRITGRGLLEVARAKKSTADGLDESLPLACFSWFAILLNMVETSAVWPQGLLDAHIAMIAKVDGDSRLWGSLRLTRLKDWVQGWIPQSVFSLGNGSPR